MRIDPTVHEISANGTVHFVGQSSVYNEAGTMNHGRMSMTLMGAPENQSRVAIGAGMSTGELWL